MTEPTPADKHFKPGTLLSFLTERPAPAEYGFIARLESLRGLAALTVAAHHSLMVLVLTPALAANAGSAETAIANWQATLGLWASQALNGHAAVMLFFVHSGFVLGLALDRAFRTFGSEAAGRFSGIKATAAFWLKRMLRLYPMQIVTMGLIATYLFWFRQTPDSPYTTEWFDYFYQTPASWGEIAQNTLLVSHTLSGVSWSLCVEVFASLLMPLMFYLNRSINRLFDVTLLCILVSFSWHPQTGFMNSIVDTYLYVFYLGLMIARWGPALFGNIPRRVALALMPVALIVLLFSDVWMHGRQNDWILAQALSATYLVAGIAHIDTADDRSPLRILDHPVAAFYGKICYSFYLLHFVALYGTGLLALAFIPAPLLARAPLLVSMGIGGVSIALATLAAWGCYHAIEAPFIRLGRKLAGNIAPTPLDNQRSLDRKNQSGAA